MPREDTGERLVILSFAIEDALIRQDIESLNNLLEAREEELLCLEEAGAVIPARIQANIREVDVRILKQLRLSRDAIGHQIKSAETRKPPVRSYRTRTGGSIDMAS